MGAMTSSSSRTNASLDAATSMTAVATATPENMKTRVICGHEFTPPPDYDDERPLYRPHGKWAWTKGFEIQSTDPGSRVSFGPQGPVNIKIGRIDGKEIVYISKLYSIRDGCGTFFPYLYLNASSNYLRPLQGDCIPWIIGVFHCLGGKIGVAQDLPHPNGWREADMFLEEHQKEAIIAAYQKLHDRGIHHGAAEYRNWLIGDDGKVNIIEFGSTSVVECDAGAKQVKVEVCPIEKIQEEMRKVKFMLNYADSREKEFKLARLRQARKQKDFSQSKSVELVDDKMHSPSPPTPEPMTDEEKASPFPAADLDQLNALMLACAQWTARRFTVERIDDCAEVVKTVIPHPPVPRAPVAAASSSSSEQVPVPVSLISGSGTAPPASAVTSMERNQLPWVAAHHAVPVDRALLNLPKSSGVSLKRPRDSELSDEFSDDEGSDTDVDSPMGSEEEDTNTVDKGKGKGRAVQAPVNKRQRREELPTAPATKPKPKPAPKSKSKGGPSKPAPLVRTTSFLDLSQPPALRSGGPSKPAPLVPTSFLDLTKPPPPFSVNGAAPYKKTKAPASAPAHLKDPEVLIAEATRTWNIFSQARVDLERLQRSVVAKKAETERCRDDFLRTILDAPTLERTSLLACIGQKDTITIVDAPSNRPTEPPNRAAQSLQHLREQRVKITSVVSNVVARPGSRPKKESPRVRDIKRFERANYVPKRPSGLSKGSLKLPMPHFSLANPRAPHGMESWDDKPPALPQPIKDMLERLAAYRRVTARRVSNRLDLSNDAEDLADLRAIREMGKAPGEPLLSDELAAELEERERRESERESKGKGPEDLKDLGKEAAKETVDDYLARAFEEEEGRQLKPGSQVGLRDNMRSKPSTSKLDLDDEPDVDLNNMDDYEPDPVDEAAKQAVYEEAAAIEAGRFSFPPFRRSPSPEFYRAQPTKIQSHGNNISPGDSSSSSSSSPSPSPPSSPPPFSSSSSPQKRKREDANEKEPNAKKFKITFTSLC